VRGSSKTLLKEQDSTALHSLQCRLWPESKQQLKIKQFTNGTAPLACFTFLASHGLTAGKAISSAAPGPP
jgi:hypothetical protein